MSESRLSQKDSGDAISFVTRAIDHVEGRVVCNSWLCNSLPESVKAISGFTGHAIRRLLNHLCAPVGTTYLEVGAYCGATATAAAYGNSGTFTTIDNFSEFNGQAAVAKSTFENAGVNVTLVEHDCWTLPLGDLPKPVDVFFYDGPHAFEDHRKALPYYFDLMGQTFVYACDDWEDEKVRVATGDSLVTLPMDIICYFDLGRGKSKDADGYWNRLGVFLLAKKA